jgi:GC-rich sequence DNA-binding factor
VDEDDDEDAFAREQLRKAVRRQHAARDSAAAAAATATAEAEAAQQGADAYGGLSSSAAGTAAARALGALGSSRQEAITSLAQGVLASLQDGVARLTASHKATQVRTSCGTCPQNLD